MSDRPVVSRTVDRLFRIALVVKGVDGALELIGAVLVLAVPGDLVNRLVAEILARDLVGPPDGTLARHLIAGTAEFSAGNRTFAVAYLALHGALKLVLVAALLKRWVQAYPVAIAVLGAFVVYEAYRAVHTGSILLPFLAALDVAIIVLVVREYVALRRGNPPRRRP